jgi:cytosine/adenosine deaminase-related metal-dependent hydrolase
VIALRAKYVLAGVELRPIEDGVVEVDEEGRIAGVGKYSGEISVDLGNAALMPQLVDAHVHPLDVVLADRDDYYIDDLVGWPHGVKYVALKRLVDRGKHLAPLKAFAKRARAYGVGHVVAFAEYAAGDVEAAFAEVGIKALAFQEAHGDLPSYPYVQVASPLDHSPEYLAELRRRAKLVATHVSETEDCHEGGDLELALDVLRADVLVHMVYATPEEIAGVPLDKVVVVNPRANAYLVGKLPDVPALLGHRPLLGTDNAFLNEPDIWAEMKFLSAYARTKGWALDDADVLRMATTWPYLKLGLGSPIDVGMPLKALAISLPYPTHNVFKFLVRRAGAQDISAFLEGREVEPPINI